MCEIVRMETEIQRKWDPKLFQSKNNLKKKLIPKTVCHLNPSIIKGDKKVCTTFFSSNLPESSVIAACVVNYK